MKSLKTLRRAFTKIGSPKWGLVGIIKFLDLVLLSVIATPAWVDVPKLEPILVRIPAQNTRRNIAVKRSRR